MHKIDSSTAVATLPTPAAVGTPGYFAAGNPALSVPYTVTTPDWGNAIQGEIVAVIQAAGIALDKTNNAQMISAMKSMFAGSTVTVFTTSGSFTVPAGVSRIKVTVTGGGGGATGSTTTGGSQYNSGAGGGGGGTAILYANVTAGTVYTVTIGAGGTGAGYNTSSGAGGTSSFGALVSATGGAGNFSLSSGSAGGPGGNGVGGTINLLGGYGGDGQSGATIVSGYGGNSFWGGGGRQAVTTPNNGQSYGSGGGGLYLSSGNGGNGAPGIVVVEY